MPGQPLREVLSRFGLEFDKTSFKRADSAVENLKGKLRTMARLALGGGALYALKNFTNEVVAMGDVLDKTSKKLGVNAQALQELRHAAQLTGVAQKSLDIGLQRFVRRASDAAKKGTGPVSDAFKELGVQLRDSSGQLRPAEELFGDVADGMKRTKTDADRVRLAFTLFDTEGVNLVNTLRGGKDELEAMRLEARELGGVMSQELIAASADYADESARMKQALQGVKNTIATALLPSMTQSLRTIKEWIRANRDWWAPRVTAAVKTFSRWVQTVGDMASFAARSISKLLDLLPEGARGFTILAGVVGLLVVLFGAIPVLVLAVIAVIDDLATYFRGGDSITAKIVEWFSELWNDFLSNPINPDDVWYVKVVQAIAKAIDWVIKGWQQLLDMPNPFAPLTEFGLDVLGAQLGFLKDAAGVVAQGLGDIKDLTAGNLQFAAGALAGGGSTAQLSASPVVGGAVTINQTIAPPAGTSAAEVGDMAAKKAARAVVDAEVRTMKRSLGQRVR